MASLLDLLNGVSIQERFACHLSPGDLLDLSRTNPNIRAMLHDSRMPKDDNNKTKLPSMVSTLSNSPESDDTPLWKRSEPRNLLLCSEPQHVKGDKVRGCRMCSKPVCEACVIKSSFKFNEGTSASRARSLCPDCYETGNVIGLMSSCINLSEGRLPCLDAADSFCSCNV